MAKVARRDGQEFDCATWLYKARSLPKDEFKREVERELTGRESEPWEIIYFKLYKTQIPIVEQAIETAALMLGTDKSRGYCLEMNRHSLADTSRAEQPKPQHLRSSPPHKLKPAFCGLFGLNRPRYITPDRNQEWPTSIRLLYAQHFSCSVHARSSG